MKLYSILDELEKLAPIRLSDSSFDNCGLQLGDKEAKIFGILLCLDVTEEAASYAVEHELNLIISHHPLFFKGVRSICANDYRGRLLYKLIQNNINVFSMHTNLDASKQGMNYVLSSLLDLEKSSVLHITMRDEETEDDYGYGLVSELKAPIYLNELAKKISEKLDAKALRYCGQPSKEIKTIAICGGSGASFIKDAVKMDADVYITGDIGHHDVQEAIEQGLSIIDAGHYDTEKHVLNHLKEYMKNKISEDVPITIFEHNEFAFHLPF